MSLRRLFASSFRLLSKTDRRLWGGRLGGRLRPAAFFHSKKRRWCTFPAVNGARCRTHLDTSELSGRIPCPLDPSHSISVESLQRHLKVCASNREANFLTQQPFFRKGVNGSKPEVPDSTSDLSSDLETAYFRAVKEVLGGGPDVANALLEISSIACERATDLCHSDKHGLQAEDLAKLLCQEVLPVSRAGESSVILEYGCGRGALSRASMKALPGSRALLVDRDTRRHKVEKRRSEGGEGILRLRLDVADFDLAAFLARPAAPAHELADTSGLGLRLRALWRQADALRSPPWPPSNLLLCTKHLCGSATDLALRSLEKAQGALPALVVVCCATCCHHRCDASTYVNLPFLQSLGLCTAENFATLAAMTGGAFGGSDVSRRRAGLMAKRVLDIGRVAFLKQLDFCNVRIQSYIGKEVTPENVAIIASKRSEDS